MKRTARIVDEMTVKDGSHSEEETRRGMNHTLDLRRVGKGSWAANELRDSY